MFGLVDFETSLVKKYCNPYIDLVYLPNRWDTICSVKFFFYRLHLIFNGLHGIWSMTVVYLWEKTLFRCIKFKKWNDTSFKKKKKTCLENWVKHLSDMCFLREHGVSSIRQRAWGLICMWCSHWKPGSTNETVKAESEEDINCCNILLLTIISIKINWESVDSQKW